MSIFNGDNEIGNILQEAVKLKSAQMGQKRKTYETWPYFVQHTLFHMEKDDIKNARELPFRERMDEAQKIKKAGNDLFQQRNFVDAVDKYEEAASLFYYCYSTDPGWRKNNRGIDDDVLVLVDEQGSNPDEAEEIKKLRLTCCLNLSACKTKLSKYEESIKACDTAIELDPNNLKALYRRAEARVKPQRSTGYDHDCAIKDLAKANALDPTDQTVKKLLEHLREERKGQRVKDQKTFSGMFDRGTIYKKELEDAVALVDASKGKSGKSEQDLTDLRKRIENISDDDPVEKRIEDAELLRDLYMQNGKEEEAKKLNEQIQQAKTALKEHREKEDEERPQVDFTNPTEEMIKEAEKYGLDLKDPLVQAELLRLERTGAAGVGEDGEPLPPPPMPAWPPLETPEDLLSAPKTEVPWLRYVLFFGVPVAAWRIYRHGLLWQAAGLLAQAQAWWASRGASEEDVEELQGGGGGTFARLYRRFFGGNDEDF